MDTKEMCLRDLRDNTSTNIKAIEYARKLNLLSSHVTCNPCNRPMSFVMKKSYGDGYVWKCPNRKCNKERTIRKNSCFENCKLSIATVFDLMYFWANDMHKHKFIMKELNLSSSTVVEWMNFMRDITVDYYESHHEKIGGPGVIVEIDECQLVRRKHHVGRLVKEQWIFGGIDRNSRKVFFVPVKDRSAKTLIACIIDNINPGSVIMSDMWRSYGGISQLSQAYVHATVNHSENFVDPVTFACTNTIESVWQELKNKHRERYGTHRPHLYSYISEFLWKYENKERRFETLIEHICSLYQC